MVIWRFSVQWLHPAVKLATSPHRLNLGTERKIHRFYKKVLPQQEIWTKGEGFTFRTFWTLHNFPITILNAVYWSCILIYLWDLETVFLDGFPDHWTMSRLCCVFWLEMSSGWSTGRFSPYIVVEANHFWSFLTGFAGYYMKKEHFSFLKGVCTVWFSSN